MIAAGLLIGVGVVLGWTVRSWKAEADEDRAWWAARPHIPGIECPPEATCSSCTDGTSS